MSDNKKNVPFFKKKRVLFLNISFIMLWVCFVIGYNAGIGGNGAFASAALALFIASALPAALAKK